MPLVISSNRQSGISIITAIVALLGLSLLGAMIAVLTSTQSESTVNEWYSAQALYAAESGIQVSAYKINHGAGAFAAGDCTAANATDILLEAGLPAWYSITTAVVTISGINTCEITATGKAGGTAASPVAQRQIVVNYKSIVVP